MEHRTLKKHIQWSIDLSFPGVSFFRIHRSVSRPPTKRINRRFTTNALLTRKFLASYGMQEFIAVITTARHWPLSIYFHTCLCSYPVAYHSHTQICLKFEICLLLYYDYCLRVQRHSVSLYSVYRNSGCSRWDGTSRFSIKKCEGNRLLLAALTIGGQPNFWFESLCKITIKLVGRSLL
jgi:hypothetical protein